MSIGAGLAGQFARAWAVLADTVQGCPAEEWARGEATSLVPARVALHTIETAEFYSREAPDGSVWGHRFGLDWEAASPEELPSQEAMLAYLGEVRARLDKWLRAASDGDLLAAQDGFPWTGETRLETMIYLLRHTQHHAAQVAAGLRHRGLPMVEWR
jgi:uncharacterized damage-inducible protein DinB